MKVITEISALITVVINEDGKNLGEMSISRALGIADAQGLDLVEVSEEPKVCKVMDYGKAQYLKSINEKLQAKKNKAVKTKEVRLKSSVEEHDLKVKVKSIVKFLESGNNVVLRLFYKGRANAHKDIGFEIVNKVLLDVQEFGSADKEPHLHGNSLSCTIKPLK